MDTKAPQMESKVTSYLDKELIKDIIIEKKKQLDRFRLIPKPPASPDSDEEFNSSEKWSSKFLPRNPGVRRLYKDVPGCLTTTHHGCAGLSLAGDPVEPVSRPSSCPSNPEYIAFANSDEKALGLGVALGEYYDCNYVGEVTDGLEVSKVSSAFSFEHQLLSENDTPSPYGHRLEFGVSARVSTENRWGQFTVLTNGSQNSFMGVRGDLIVFLNTRDGDATLIEHIPFFDLSKEGYHYFGESTFDDDSSNFEIKFELPVSRNFTSYEATIAVQLTAYRDPSQGGFVGINLSGRNPMWVGDIGRSGPIVISKVWTKLCPERLYQKLGQ